MQRSLYFSRLGNKVYTITIPKSGRCCLVGMTNPEASHRLNVHISSTPAYRNAAEDAYALFSSREVSEIEVASVDFQEEAFYRMMKLNNFALLVCDDFVASDEEIAFDGSLVDPEYPPDDEHRMYFERLLNLPSE
jgi:hypothetical protein